MVSIILAAWPAAQRPSSGEPLEPAMLRIAAATVRIGDPGWPHTAPRDVPLREYWLARRELTRGEFARFVAATGGARAGESLSPPDLPMTGIDWYRASEYAAWLSRETGRAYRLPTSSEWEAAARVSGATSAFEWGESDLPPVGAVANLADLSAWREHGVIAPVEMFPLAEAAYDDGYPALAPVGSFPSSVKGLQDLTGNAAEWCSDEYENDVTPGSGEYRAVRGSSFVTRRIAEARIGRVTALRADTRHIGVGVRLARSE